MRRVFAVDKDPFCPAARDLAKREDQHPFALISNLKCKLRRGKPGSRSSICSAESGFDTIFSTTILGTTL